MVKKKHYERILNCIPSKETEKDWTYDSFVDAGLIERKYLILKILERHGGE